MREDPVVDKGKTRKIGVEIKLANHFDSIFINSSCSNFDTALSAASMKLYDTIWISPLFNIDGQCILSARATMRNSALKDKSTTLSIVVLPQKTGVRFTLAPQTFTATIGKTNMVMFVTQTTRKSDEPVVYSFSTEPPSDRSLFILEQSPFGDTARIFMNPVKEGASLLYLVVSTTCNGSIFSDTASVAIVVGNKLIPSVVDIPDQIVSGEADTLFFIVDNSTCPDPLTISMITKTPLDSAVFHVIPTGPDSILIAVSSTATPTTANIGIITSNGTITDTSWYPVTIISKNDVLWNTAEISMNAVEGIPLIFDLKPLLSGVNVPDVSVSADIGKVSSDKIWSYTPPWGCDSIIKVKIDATAGNASSTLVLKLSVAVGDTVKPIIMLVDNSFDGKKVSSSQVKIDCIATDMGSGIESVTITCGTLTVPATLEKDSIYSGVITGLVHGVSTPISITATDASRKKNRSTITITVIRDSTMLDTEAPVILQLTGPKSGERVTTPTGTIKFSITDNSGVDSV